MVEAHQIKAKLIDKEAISGLTFPKEEINDAKKRKELIHMLERATVLGNLHKNKSKIYFEDSEGLKYVHTTIWATGTDNISLKGGLIIPINRIVEIEVI